MTSTFAPSSFRIKVESPKNRSNKSIFIYLHVHRVREGGLSVRTRKGMDERLEHRLLGFVDHQALTLAVRGIEDIVGSVRTCVGHAFHSDVAKGGVI